MNLKLLIPIISLTEGTLGSVLIHDVNISPFRFSKSLDLDQNSQVNFTLSGSVVCTRDIPISDCYHSVTASRITAVEFLFHSSTLPLQHSPLPDTKWSPQARKYRRCL